MHTSKSRPFAVTLKTPLRGYLTTTALLPVCQLMIEVSVVQAASALEGPNSPIESLLAAETSHEQITSVPMSGEQPDLAASPNNGNLADRIRALQTHASRLAQATGDKTRN